MDDERREIEIPELPPYTLVFNSVIQDERLRLQTRALLILMLSRPPGWNYSVRGMAKVAGVTKDTVSKMFRELEECGYIQRKAQLREDGKFARGGGGYLIYIPGLSSPCPNLSDTVLPDTVSYDRVNNEILNNKQDTPKAPRGGVRQNEPKSAPAWKPERFAGLWSFYPKAGRKKRQSAIAAWEKLHPDDELIDQIAKALKAQRSSDEWQRGIGIPYLSTYLNQRRWEEADEPEDEEPFEEVAYGWR